MMNAIDQLVLVYDLPLDSFTIDVIFRPNASARQVREPNFKWMQPPFFRMDK